MSAEQASSENDRIGNSPALSCSAAEYYEDGAIEFCRLAHEAILSGQTLPPDTGVHLTQQGLLDWCFLPQNTEIQGILARGHGHDFMTEFHPNGRLKRAYLAGDQRIQGIPCAKFRFWSAVFWPIHGKKGGTDFHDNGQLGYCELSEAIEIDGISFKRRAPVRLDRDGKLVTD